MDGDNRAVHPMQARKVTSFSVYDLNATVAGVIGPMGFEMTPEFAHGLGMALVKYAEKAAAKAERRVMR